MSSNSWILHAEQQIVPCYFIHVLHTISCYHRCSARGCLLERHVTFSVAPSLFIFIFISILFYFQHSSLNTMPPIVFVLFYQMLQVLVHAYAIVLGKVSSYHQFTLNFLLLELLSVFFAVWGLSYYYSLCYFVDGNLSGDLMACGEVTHQMVLHWTSFLLCRIALSF